MKLLKKKMVMAKATDISILFVILITTKIVVWVKKISVIQNIMDTNIQNITEKDALSECFSS